MAKKIKDAIVDGVNEVMDAVSEAINGEEPSSVAEEASVPFTVHPRPNGGTDTVYH